jgi:hypothetical protein
MFYLVQPYGVGRDRYQRATVVSAHVSIEAAYAELDRIAAKLVSGGNRSDAIELYVVDEARQPVRRPSVQ